jgi:hypothetical protein
MLERLQQRLGEPSKNSRLKLKNAQLMATANFTRLFSNSGLLSTCMKSTTLALLFVLVGCGGSSANLTPATAQSAPIAASQVFGNIAETWTFQNGYGDISTIDVMPQADGSTVWHYLKNADRAYWAPGVSQAELYFYLAPDSNGQWYSTGGHIIFPIGCPWCSGPLDLKYTVGLVPGLPRPYLIIGDSGTGVDTAYEDSSGPNGQVHWRTKMYVEDGFLISEQWEGDCPTQAHEKWWFKPGAGLWKVEPLTQGNCYIPTDPNLIVQRISQSYCNALNGVQAECGSQR